MALSDERIDDLARNYGLDWVDYELFARAIEAEVRKQDDALILMLVERLERADNISGHANNKAAIKAGRAWLEAKK